VLLNREISIPLRNIRKSPSPHGFASTCLPAGIAASKAILDREPNREPLGNCTKEV
jgi:hypothetical protein